jgi:hypothetical protein
VTGDRATLIARFCWAANSPGSGSLRTSAPGGTVIESRPLKVTCRLVPGTTVAPDSWRPTVTRPNVTGRVPKTFDKETRKPVPPMLVRTMLRTVWLLTVAFSLAALAAQVPTWVVFAAVGAAGAATLELRPIPPRVRHVTTAAVSHRRDGPRDRCVLSICAAFLLGLVAL